MNETWYSRNKTTANARSKAWRLANLERAREIERRSYQKTGHKVRVNKRYRKYKITKEDYNSMLLGQRGVCAICEKKPKGEFHIDHNHKIGKVRGILCPSCNFRLSGLDDYEWHAKAIDYLSKRG